MLISLEQPRSLGHPELSLLSFDLGLLLTELRTGFPQLQGRRIEVWIRRQATLASISTDDVSSYIQLHSVLNHPDTPREVIAFILWHELLHLVIPGREVDGKWRSHPPEFWEAERVLGRNRVLPWIWLRTVLASCLRNDTRHECVWVKANWKQLMTSRRPKLIENAASGGFDDILAQSEAVPLF